MNDASRKILATLCFVLTNTVAFGGEQVIVTRTGPAYRGKVTKLSHTEVDTGIKKVWLRNAEVVGTTAAAAAAALPAYDFNAAALRAPKKGELGPVLRDLKWGRPLPGGKLPLTCKCFKQGDVSTTMAITRVTPTMVTLTCVDYKLQLEYPLAGYWPAVRPLLAKVPRKTEADKLRFADFLYRSGQQMQARMELRAQPDSDAVKKLKKRWATVEKNRREEAGRLKNAIAAASGAAQVGPAGLSAEDGGKLAKLQPLVDEYFRAGKAQPGEKLAVAARKVPLGVLARAIRSSAPFERPADAAQWTRRTVKGSREFEYWIQLPPGYRKGVRYPLMIALHGQVSKAPIMIRYIGKRALARGMIFVSPEYIYGRKWGYKYSAEEHESVFVTLRDVVNHYNVDCGRAYLHGHSQGGHASWDIGASHAERFAGVSPYIGVLASEHHLPNLGATSLYVVEGEKDRAAPVINRARMSKLLAANVDGVYVEYKNRGHEAFYEEHDANISWLLTRRRPLFHAGIHARVTRPNETRHGWLELLGGTAGLRDGSGFRRIAPVGFPLLRAGLSADGAWISAPLKLRTRLHLPPEVVAGKKSIEVKLGFRTLKKSLTADPVAMLREALERGDRHQLVAARVEVP